MQAVSLNLHTSRPDFNEYFNTSFSARPCKIDVMKENLGGE
jgi:uncharacterized protein YfeS